jgi:uncharacterized phage-associated protein
MASVHDVAAFILSEQGKMGTMKLQKLVYYAQAWSMVWDGRRLFPERIEAWKHGPVVRELYDQHARMPFIRRLERGDASKLTDKQRATIRAVLAFYGDRSEWWLSKLTHREAPWIEARAESKGARSPTITIVALRKFFSSYSTQPRRIPDSVARGFDLLVGLPEDAADDLLTGELIEVHGLEDWLRTGKGNPWQTSEG